MVTLRTPALVQVATTGFIAVSFTLVVGGLAPSTPIAIGMGALILGITAAMTRVWLQDRADQRQAVVRALQLRQQAIRIPREPEDPRWEAALTLVGRVGRHQPALAARVQDVLGRELVAIEELRGMVRAESALGLGDPALTEVVELRQDRVTTLLRSLADLSLQLEREGASVPLVAVDDLQDAIAQTTARAEVTRPLDAAARRDRARRAALAHGGPQGVATV